MLPQPHPQSQQTSPEGSQMGSSVSTVGYSGASTGLPHQRDPRQQQQHQSPRTASSLVVPTIISQRDVKGTGRETIDEYTDSGAIAVIGSTRADSIPSPPPLNLSAGISSPPRPISYSLPLTPLATSSIPTSSLATPVLDPSLSIPPIPPNSPP
ncbi:hypothetical protein C8R41DRAFT_914779 [Lentinula lateritia]|uniref:Uncharacterized protein n=1 Tax=Lentinula lateritia TaxID=40482 RepID=A0ABQ8VU40_9AGAR|nr:hypothetical protein C8R41DRAFT_914779 [Lentinula lateritia]